MKESRNVYVCLLIYSVVLGRRCMLEARVRETGKWGIAIEWGICRLGKPRVLLFLGIQIGDRGENW